MDAIDEVAEHTDMNEAQAGGGGDYVPPAEGLVRLRFIGYVEHGVHSAEYNGKPKKEERVWLNFELSGPKHPPREDGSPQTLSFTMSKSQNEKSHFYKLFKRMNYDGKARHIAQLLGKAFLGEIVHKKGANDKVHANLRNADGYTIRSPHAPDFDTGEMRLVAIDEAKSPLKCFLWDANPKALKAMWDDIFIDGRWDDKKDEAGNIITPGRSKNYHQERIRAAVNFQGSPICQVLFDQGGEVIDLPTAAKPERTEENVQATADAKAGASADPLAGVA